LTFAKQYIDYLFETTIFVDESVFAADESGYGWSRIGTRIPREKSKYLPTPRVFGAISMFGKLILAFYSANLDQYAYQKFYLSIYVLMLTFYGVMEFGYCFKMALRVTEQSQH